MFGESQSRIDPWNDIDEFVSGLTAAGVHFRFPDSVAISLDQAGRHVKPILQVSQILFYTEDPPPDVVGNLLEREPYMEYRLEDANGNEVKFPIRVVIDGMYPDLTP